MAHPDTVRSCADITLGAAAPLVPTTFTARESALIRRALGLLEARSLHHGPVLDHPQVLEHYLRLRFAGLTNEQAHVLYLDTRRQLIEAHTEAFGTQSRVPFDMRPVILRAITVGAEHVVLAHNHPSGNLVPSDADLHHLWGADHALRAVGIGLLDSYVVTPHHVTSIRAYKARIDQRHDRAAAAAREQRTAQRRAKRAATLAAKQGAAV